MTFEQWWMQNERQLLFDLQIRDGTGTVHYDTLKEWAERIYAAGMGAAGMQYGRPKHTRKPPVEETCLACAGTGGIFYEPGLIVIECKKCKGKGKV